MFLSTTIPTIPTYIVAKSLSQTAADVSAAVDSAAAAAAAATAAATAAAAAQDEVDTLELAVENLSESITQQVVTQGLLDAVQDAVMNDQKGILSTVNTTLTSHGDSIALLSAKTQSIETLATTAQSDVQALARETDAKFAEVATGLTTVNAALASFLV